MKPNVLKHNAEPELLLSGKKLEWVDIHEYLGVIISTDMKDDLNVREQCRKLYGRGNMIIRNFSSCSVKVKCELFQAYCTNLYCSSLWVAHSVESIRLLKVAYNRIFRILVGFSHRTSMSNMFIKHELDPIPVILRKSIGSFRRRILKSDNQR